jgi:hypothetical protein
LQAICTRHRVPLGAAALQFVLAHPVVASVVPGAVAPQEVRQNIGFLEHPIPGDFWTDLKASGLLHPPCPCPYFVDRAVRPAGANRRLLRNRRFALRTLFNPHAASIAASGLSESAPD